MNAAGSLFVQRFIAGELLFSTTAASRGLPVDFPH